jgi:hypothetical protein
MFETLFHVNVPLEGHSHEKGVFEIIPLNESFGPN